MRRIDGHVAGLLLLLIAAVALLCAAPAPAFAEFGSIELQSVGQLEQFESAGESAISADGRYLAFEGTLAGVRGIYRKDLESGENGQLQLVVGGSLYAGTGPIDASAPSISDDGRYVSFTSTAQLVKAARPGSNVYVRDMQAPAPASGGACDEEEEKQENGRRCAYELASALNGSEEGLTYGKEGEPSGAVASGRVALSESGREVVFVIGANSDLESHDPAELTTPRLQVAVRYLERDAEHNRDETVLVSAEREPSTAEMTERPVIGGAVTPSAQYETTGSALLPGAALSGDGSTVAWLGAHIPAQAPTLSGERRSIEEDDERGQNETYDEPLWRRIEGGPQSPTRRMVGGGDPLAPGCPAGATIEVPACQGPYLDLGSEHWEQAESNDGWLGIAARCDGTPQLSRDGWTAALVGDPDGSSNVYVVNMDEGLDRDQADRQLTREVPVANVAVPGLRSAYVSGAAEITEAAISADGTRIAFTTQRQQFPLAPPNYSETPPAALGVTELYEIDLAGESLVRVTHGPGGGPSLEGGEPPAAPSYTGASTPSYTEDGLTLAFADTASNLVYGDANKASDVFTVNDSETPTRAGPVEVGQAALGQDPPAAQWRLSVVPVVRPDGSVVLQVDVPAAGELSAAATATVPVAVRESGRAGRGHAASGGGRRGAAGRIALVSRTVASARMPATLAGLLELPLRVSPRYAKLLTTKAGIYATIRVSFEGNGGPPLAQTVTVPLRRIAKKRAKAAKPRARALRPSARGRAVSYERGHR